MNRDYLTSSRSRHGVDWQTINAPDMESALKQSKASHPGNSGHCVYNPDHMPPTDSPVELKLYYQEGV